MTDSMDSTDGTVPPDLDTERPSTARVYDFFLGGDHNFAVDRQLARQIQATSPTIGESMRANRSVLRRMVQELVAAGIDQFLDIGSGIPTVGNVHEVAQNINPRARVVYVDVDPLAVAYSRHILRGNPSCTAVRGDVRNVEAVLGDPQVHHQLDFGRPVAVLLVSMLHFLPDDADPAAIIDRIADAVPSGSHLAITHATSDGQPPEVLMAQGLAARTGTPVNMRSHAEISTFFARFPLLDPGLVFLPYWRPDDPAEIDDRDEVKAGYAGLGRKP